MLNQAFFVSPVLHERSIKLPDGSVHTMHFRQLPHTQFRGFLDANRSKDEAVRLSALSRLIADSLCNPDGTPAITIEEASLLNHAAATEIGEAALDVSGALGNAGKA